MYSCITFKGGSTEAVHSGLARQVSSLLTNHLARATECCGNQAAGNDALQDVLSLLNDLSRYYTMSLEYFFLCMKAGGGSFGDFFIFYFFYSNEGKITFKTILKLDCKLTLTQS